MRNENMKVMRQSTYETCLACCLLMMVGKTKKDEIEIWRHGWKFNYLIGQLNYVASKYGKKFKVYVENKHYFNQLQKQKSKSVKLVNKKIDARLLSELLKDSKVIIYLDNYYLQKIIHTPHFILAIGKSKEKIELADPYDGKLKKMPTKTIIRAIISLRNYLRYSPPLIRLG